MPYFEPLRRQFLERASVAIQRGFLATELLITANYNVAVLRFQLHHARMAAGLLARDQRCARPAERIFCGVARYVASAPIVEGMPASCSGRTPHNEVSSKRLQECHQSCILAPRLLRFATLDFAEG